MTKSAALRIRIDPDLHREFLAICKVQDIPASHLLRQFMKSYVDNFRHGQQTDLFEFTNEQKHD